MEYLFGSSSPQPPKAPSLGSTSKAQSSQLGKAATWQVPPVPPSDQTYSSDIRIGDVAVPRVGTPLAGVHPVSGLPLRRPTYEVEQDEPHRQGESSSKAHPTSISAAIYGSGQYIPRPRQSSPSGRTLAAAPPPSSSSGSARKARPQSSSGNKQTPSRSFKETEKDTTPTPGTDSQRGGRKGKRKDGRSGGSGY